MGNIKADEYQKLQNGSDIRGIAVDGVPGEEVNLSSWEARNIALGFLDFLIEKTGKEAEELTVAIGRDPRLSGALLAASIKNTLCAYKVHATDYGLCSTPAMFMSTVFPEIAADGAIMITASHLPYNRNGFKFFTKKGGVEKEDIRYILEHAAECSGKQMTIYEKWEADSDDMASDNVAGDPNNAPKMGSGDPHNASKEEVSALSPLMELYVAHLRSIIIDKLSQTAKRAAKGHDTTDNDDKPLAGLKIAVDAGNGSGGFFANNVLAPLGCDVSCSEFLEPDGNFPNHQPNPENEQAMKAVTKATLSGGCDLGLIFDTDVDRSSAVDERGREINRNGIVAMAAALIASDHPGTTVVTDSITSNELTEFLEQELGLKHLRYKRGYRNVINKSIELNNSGIDSELAIETSGHAAYKSNYFLDDGAYLATLIVIRTATMKREKRGISELISDLREPAEAVEVRMPILTDDFAVAGDSVLAHIKEWVKAPPVTRGSAPSDFAENLDAEGQNSMHISNKIVTDISHHDNIDLTLVEPNYEGVRVAISGDVNGWFLIRKSLHDPIMPLNIESEEVGGTEKIRAILRECLWDQTDLDISKL